MLKEFSKFRGWTVLNFFLKHPNEKIHVNGLAKRLSISSLTANTYLNLFANDGLLKKKKIANADFYSLKNNFLSRELKKCFELIKLNESNLVDIFIKNNPEIQSIAIYGSIASGEQDDKSDLDLLIISERNNLELSFLNELEKRLEREINISVMSFTEWRKQIDEKNDFVSAVLKKNVLIYGNGLIE